MKITRRKRFRRMYRQLDRKYQESVNGALRLLVSNPMHPDLSNHQLKGGLKGKRAISAGFDLRIIFETEDEYAHIVLVSVGTHDDVYK